MKSTKKKLYNVHVGVRYTADILVEAENEDIAKDIVSNHLDSIELDTMKYAGEDYDIWEENENNYSKYYIMNDCGRFEERQNR